MVIGKFTKNKQVKLFTTLIVIVWVNFAYAQNNYLELKKDSSLLNFVSKQASKHTFFRDTFILKFYFGGIEICKLKVTKDSLKNYSIDTLFFFSPHNLDTLLYKDQVKRYEIIGSSRMDSSMPVLNSGIILPNVKNKLNYLETYKDSLREKNKGKNFQITLTNEVEFGNNFYPGMNNRTNPRVINSVLFETNLIGIPISLGTSYSNFRTDNSLNLSDFRLNIDILKYKQDLYNNDLLVSKKLNTLKFDKKITEIELNNLDSEIFALENSVNNKYNIEKYNENKSLSEFEKVKLEELEKNDTILKNKVPKSDLTNLQRNFEIEKFEKEQEKLEKLKTLKKVKLTKLKNFDENIIEEKKNLLSPKNLRANVAQKSKLKKGLGWLYSLNRLDIGRISPIYSELTLNGLTYLGLNTQFNLNNTEISLTTGRLNNFSSYMQSLNSDLGGSIHGLKINKKSNNSNKYVSLLYINPESISFNNQSKKFLIGGVGGIEKIFDNLNLQWELAYSETDTVNELNRSSKKLFSKFNPYALAYQLSFNGSIDSKSNFEIGAKYVGYDFNNPASYNLRNDFLRTNLKINRQFEKYKINLTYQLKYDMDNFSNLKSASSKITNNNFVLNYRISKALKTNLVYNHTFVSNTIENEFIGNKEFLFINHLVNWSLIQSTKKKTTIVQNIFNFNYNFSENTSDSMNTTNKLNQISYNSVMDFTKLNIRTSGLINYQYSSSDTTNGVGFLFDIAKNFNIVNLNLLLNYRLNDKKYSYKSIGCKVGLTKNRLNCFLHFEYYAQNDNFDNKVTNSNGLILKTSLSIKF